MNQLAYAVGGLLYTPAGNKDVAKHILQQDWPGLTSVSLCLEDSTQDAALPEAEKQLQETLETLSRADAALPLLFVRVRTPEHLRHIHTLLGAAEEILTGYIFPKFDMSNAHAYLACLAEINAARTGAPLYAMPILESRAAADVCTRRENLAEIRDAIAPYRDLILNIRVGGNDFCHLFGLRRRVTQTIYDLGVVRDTLIDILNVFSQEYVVSGPVWEYYGRDTAQPWAEGLRRELALDRANGFLGKTAIHPSQLPLIYESMKVSAADLADANEILDWADDARAVSGSSTSGRMNEVKCHGRWAEKIAALGAVYGVTEG